MTNLTTAPYPRGICGARDDEDDAYRIAIATSIPERKILILFDRTHTWLGFDVEDVMINDSTKSRQIPGSLLGLLMTHYEELFKQKITIQAGRPTPRRDERITTAHGVVKHVDCVIPGRGTQNMWVIGRERGLDQAIVFNWKQPVKTVLLTKINTLVLVQSIVELCSIHMRRAMKVVLS